MKNRIFAELLIQNNLNPKGMRWIKNAYVKRFNNHMTWRYYVDSDVLEIETEEVKFLGGAYEKKCKSL